MPSASARSIVGVHDQLKEELSLATEEIAVRLATSGEAFASMIDTRAATLMEKSDTRHPVARHACSRPRPIRLLQTLTSSGFALSHEFDTRLESLSSDAQRARRTAAQPVRNPRLHAGQPTPRS